MPLSAELTIPNLHDLSAERSERVFPGAYAGADRQLSPRQTELLQLLADGKIMKDAAIVMGIKERTAVNYSKLIRDRLEAETTLHAAIIALRIGLIT